MRRWMPDDLLNAEPFDGDEAYTGGTQSGYFTELLVNDVEESQIPTNTSDPTINEAHAVAKSSQGRTKNFSTQEDKLLVSAWLNVDRKCMCPVQRRFTLMHCWSILKDEPKWMERQKEIGCAKKTSKKKKQKTMANSSHASVEPAGPDAAGGFDAQPAGRSDGKKKEKQKLRQGRTIEVVNYLMQRRKKLTLRKS